jgi:hypothetical protein
MSGRSGGGHRREALVRRSRIRGRQAAPGTPYSIPELVLRPLLSRIWARRRFSAATLPLLTRSRSSLRTSCEGRTTCFVLKFMTRLLAKTRRRHDSTRHSHADRPLAWAREEVPRVAHFPSRAAKRQKTAGDGLHCRNALTFVLRVNPRFAVPAVAGLCQAAPPAHHPLLSMGSYCPRDRELLSNLGRPRNQESLGGHNAVRRAKR